MWSTIFSKLLWCYSAATGGLQNRTAPGFQASSDEEGKAFATKMAPVLANFEVVRERTYRAVESAAKFWVPAGLLAGLALTAVQQYASREPNGVFVVLGLALGMYLAARKPVADYRAAFKADVIPNLLSRFGDFKQSQSSTMNVAPLTACGLLPGNAEIELDDEIEGTYRGHRVSMAELKVMNYDSNDDKAVLFDGLVLQFALPREVSGRTIIAPVSMVGKAGAARSWLSSIGSTSNSLQTVSLESPAFTKCYNVLSDDQVGARVLLSPAFMERLMRLEPEGATRESRNLRQTMAELKNGSPQERVAFVKTLFKPKSMLASVTALAVGQTMRSRGNMLAKVISVANPAFAKKVRSASMTFATIGKALTQSRVLAVAENGQLLIAIPKSDAVDYFEPPPFHAKSNADAVLMHLSIDIQTMLNVADSVFDLDYRTSVADRGTPVIDQRQQAPWGNVPTPASQAPLGPSRLPSVPDAAVKGLALAALVSI